MRPLRGQVRRVPRRARGRADLDRRARRDHLHGPHRGAVRRAARAQQGTDDRRHLRRSRRTRREPLLGPGRVQEAGEAPPLPVAPGQRVRLRRAAAVPHHLAGPHRRHRGQRLPVGRARAAPARARCSTPTSTRSAGSACPSPRARWPLQVPAGGAVVFSSLTPHLTGPNTTDGVRKAYILQYAPSRRRGAPGRPERRPARDPGGGRRARPAVPRACGAVCRADHRQRRRAVRRGARRGRPARAGARVHRVGRRLGRRGRAALRRPPRDHRGAPRPRRQHQHRRRVDLHASTSSSRTSPAWWSTSTCRRSTCSATRWAGSWPCATPCATPSACAP